MNNFFDTNLFQQIFSGIVVLLVSIWLGAKSGSPTTSGKGWKVLVIFSWVLILGGLYTASINTPNGGWSNPYVGLGLSLAVIGLFLKYVGKFFIWWHR